MKPGTRKAALRAVAQLTWAGGWTAVLACGGHSSGDSPSNAGSSTGGESRSVGAANGPPAPTPAAPVESTATAGTPAAAMGGDASATGRAASATGGATSETGGAAETGGAGGATEPLDQLACTAAIAFDPQDLVKTSVSDADLACCVDEVLAKMSDTAAKGDPSVVNCCTAIVLGSTATSPYYGSPVRGYCCYGGVVAKAEALYDLSYCTPWGPPVPPHLAEAEA